MSALLKTVSNKFHVVLFKPVLKISIESLQFILYIIFNRLEYITKCAQLFAEYREFVFFRER